MTGKTTVYYDGLCLACSTEINHYRKLEGSDKLSFIDITLPEFKAEEHQLDPQKVHKVMHVKDKNGELHEGVEAFRVIWRELPRYQTWSKWSEKPGMSQLLNMGYQAFATVRPWLPRRKAKDCSASPYCEK